MIKMKEERLPESLSSEVYHYTNTQRALNIINSNKFYLTSNLGTSADQIGGSEKYYYLSVSRVKWGGYARSDFYEKRSAVILVLDGRRFNHRYKGGAVDYWGREFRKGSISKHYKLRNDENEERVFSDKPSIPSAIDYIKEVHVYLNPDSSEYDRYAHTLIKVASENNIDTYYYMGDDKSFKLLNKNKAHKDIPYERGLRGFTKFVGAVLDNDILEIKDSEWYFLLNYIAESARDEEDVKLYVKDNRQLRDRISSVEADIHNLRSADIGARVYLHRLTRYMKKLKVRSMNELTIKLILELRKLDER